MKRLKTQSTLSQTLMTMGPLLDYWLRQPSGVKVNKMLLMMMMMAMMMVMIYIYYDEVSVCVFVTKNDHFLLVVSYNHL